MATGEIRFAWMVAPWSAYGWGNIAVEVAGDALTRIGLLNGWYNPPPGVKPRPDDPLLSAAIEQIYAYLNGTRRSFDLPLNPGGTAFENKVWRELSAIPYGGTRTYGEIAVAVGSPRGARAVGGAVGANPLPIIIPCHRVLRAGGKLGGYGGHTERDFKLKCFFLALEGAERPPDCDRYSIR
ncbi:MAG TPA: methylated-DNA--[protein]-cysteine S-methyltransferase [bacterium]|nr:methylated-DNA--[protein]-cysteine S-methyltransferase [bacterium]